MIPTTYRIIVTAHAGRPTGPADALVQGCYLSRLYLVHGALHEAQARQLAEALLVDPVTETFNLQPAGHPPPPAALGHTLAILYRPGVTDPAADNLRRAAGLLGFNVSQAATGHIYQVVGATPDGRLPPDKVLAWAGQHLFNPLIQQAALDAPHPLEPFLENRADQAPAGDGWTESIPLRHASPAELSQLSQLRRLALDRDEMQAIQAYYQAEGRDPTDVELETVAQTWSEHCVHKTFKATIAYTGPDGTQEIIHGLLDSTIRAATEKINKPWVRSAFVDNAGIIRFNEAYDLAFKVETHNHPSALEPFGGANTGVGGVIRDILGVSARPLANTNILCFGWPDTRPEMLPAGVLHPARVAEGVVRGIEDYGNKMGIPTVNGAVVYHTGYTANPLVYCGCLGLLPHGSHPRQVQAGDLIVSLGGRVGRDGLRGATFSSLEMDHTTGAVAGTSVQIGNPIMEKQTLEVVLRARAEQLYHAITDCGAGGYSSAIGELAAELGATVELDRIPVKYPGLHPWELWLSEAQERMVLAVPPDRLAQLQSVAAGQDVEATVLGVFQSTGRLRLRYAGRIVGDLSLTFLHGGRPARLMSAIWQAAPPATPPAQTLRPAREALLALLAHPNVRSKEGIIRRYDHEVQGSSALRPLVGVADHGPGDAAVLIPLEAQTTTGPVRGVALGNGICPTYGELDPYAMAWAAIDEAIRNVVAVGANPDEIALLDNFCWGNPHLPDRLGGLVRCAQGCHDAAMAYRAPFISGKDSLNNEYTGADGEKHAIPGTLLISAIGPTPDVTRTVSMDLKRPGNALYLLGETDAEMGGSLYALLHGEAGGKPPQPRVGALPRYRALHRAIRQGLVAACHDLSEGGLGVALAEMALAGRLGARIELRRVPATIAHNDILLFSESLGRFLLEVRPEDEERLQRSLAAEAVARIGEVTDEPTLVVHGYHGETYLRLSLAEVEEAWRGHLLFLGEKGVLAEDAMVAADFPAAASSRPARPAPALKRPPRVLVLHANGANRDHEAARACELAGGAPEIVHLNQLLHGQRRLRDYHMLVIPGGFSYGDDLGAGVLLAAALRYELEGMVSDFVAAGRPTLGICNGFQALVKANLFPAGSPADTRPITLTTNASGRFECRWVTLRPNPASPCLFTQGLTDPIACPVAHGEGRFVMADADTAAWLTQHNLISLTYTPATYPGNPNGSALAVAGLTNPAGNVLGLMPHPENYIYPWQHPRWRRAGLHPTPTGFTPDGLRLFINGIQQA